MDYQLIGNNIRKLRIGRNLTQETFSEAIGISVSYLGQLERGQRNPSISTLESIANTLEVPLSALLCELKEEEQVSCIWKQKTENLSTKEKETLLRVLGMVLDLAITRQS